MTHRITNTRRRAATGAALVPMVIGFGALGTITAAATGGGGPVAQSVLGSGSDTTQFMMQGLDGLYLSTPGCAQTPTSSGTTPWLDFSCQSPDPTGTVTSENYSYDQVHEANFLGSSVGIKQLCTQGQTGVAPIDFARSSRGPSAKAGDCAGLRFVAYARDAISWEAFDQTYPTGSTPPASGIHGMVNNTSGTTCAGSGGATQFCLTQSQLQGIYITCTITNWKQVGGNNVPISIYTPQAGSGTRATWDGFVGGDSSSCIGKTQPDGTVTGLGTNTASGKAGHIIPENSNTGIPATDQAGAIFPFSYGVWTTQVKGAGGAVLGAIDNVAPTATTIQDLSFPYGRYLFNVYCSASCPAASISSAATVKYVGEEGWICKVSANHTTNPQTGNNYRTDIENAIRAAGFVPLTVSAIGGGDSNSDYCRLTTT